MRIMTKKKYGFKQYRRLLRRGQLLKKEKTFHQESKKVFTWLQFDESKQSFGVFMVNFPPSRNVIVRKCK